MCLCTGQTETDAPPANTIGVSEGMNRVLSGVYQGSGKVKKSVDQQRRRSKETKSLQAANSWGAPKWVLDPPEKQVTSREKILGLCLLSLSRHDILLIFV